MSTRLRSSAERAANQSVKSAPARRRRSDHERPAPAFELLESKLLPPQGPAGAVSREALIDVMERATAVPVVFLSAGPGWGKTTLLAEWAARSSRSFAWVNIDDKDNDPIVLLTYVATAVDRVAPIDAEGVRGPDVAGRLGRGDDRAAAGRSAGRRRRAARAGP